MLFISERYPVITDDLLELGEIYLLFFLRLLTGQQLVPVSLQ
jgi:hypothetical protein